MGKNYHRRRSLQTQSKPTMTRKTLSIMNTTVPVAVPVPVAVAVKVKVKVKVKVEEEEEEEAEAEKEKEKDEDEDEEDGDEDDEHYDKLIKERINNYENKNKTENKKENANENDNKNENEHKKVNKNKNKNENENENENKNERANRIIRDNDFRKEYQHQDNTVPNNVIRATNTTQEGEWVRFLRTGKDKYNRLIIKAKDTLNKIKTIKENSDNDDDDNEYDDEDDDNNNKNAYYLSKRPRTREQALNNKYVLRQQMECRVTMLAHDCD